MTLKEIKEKLSSKEGLKWSFKNPRYNKRFNTMDFDSGSPIDNRMQKIIFNTVEKDNIPVFLVTKNNRIAVSMNLLNSI